MGPPVFSTWEIYMKQYKANNSLKVGYHKNATLRSGNTGNIFLQLALQHCCSASWNSLLRVLPPAWPTCLATKYDVAGWGDVFAKSRLEFYFLQQILVLLLVLPLKLQLVSQQIWFQRLWLAVSEARLPGKLEKKHGGRSGRRRRVWSCRPETLGKPEILNDYSREW